MSSSYKCILCNSEGKVSDYQDLFCIIFGFDTPATQGICAQAFEKSLGGENKLSKCL